MKGYHSNIEELTQKNDNFRQVLYTGQHTQLVLMALEPNQDIGQEIHAQNDQFFRFESGQGLVIIDGHEYPVADGSAIIVPAGSQHNVINTSATEKLKLYTLYSPPHHKEEAEANDQEFDGLTTETK